jgi:hypothetical protein
MATARLRSFNQAIHDRLINDLRPVVSRGCRLDQAGISRERIELVMLQRQSCGLHRGRCDLILLGRRALAQFDAG